jgi:predicted phosphohydrolase
MDMATAAQLAQVDDVSTFYLSQGVLGASCVVMMACIAKLWHSREKDRLDHKAEIDAKDKLIFQLQDERLKEAIAARQAIHTASQNATVEALMSVARKGST